MPGRIPPMSSDPQTLNDQFAIDGAVRFEAGEGGLPLAVVETPDTAGGMYLHGGHVTRWRPAGHNEVLWLSDTAVYRDGKAIRGGVPVCFPWFGPKQDDPNAPSHGLVRTAGWDVAETAGTADGAQVTMTRRAPPWACTITAEFGPALAISLTAAHTGNSPASFEAALHTYLAVSDVRRITVTGLEGAEYLDQVAGRMNRQGAGPIVFAGETDNVYFDTAGDVVVHDPVWGRRLVVSKAGAESTVVWNPWTDKAARLADVADSAWPGFVCIETAAIGRNAVTLAPGESHEIVANLRVEPM